MAIIFIISITCIFTIGIIAHGNNDEKVVSLSKKGWEVILNNRDKGPTQEMIDLYNKIKHQLK
jgi:hypothetical protein